MKSQTPRFKSPIYLSLVAFATATAQLAPIEAFAQASESAEPPTALPKPPQYGQRDPEAAATRRVNEAVAVVRRMEADSTMRKVAANAQGVFIVPTYGRAAFGVGGQGGTGVLLIKKSDGRWSDPAFYTIGGINIGAQAGAEVDPIAFTLNNDKAVQRFTEKNNFSLSADAGLTVLNWNKVAEGSTGAGDVTAWAGTKGLFGNIATVGVNDIHFNQRANNAYYHQTQNVSITDVISGKVKNPGSDSLKQALAEIVTGTASGRSSGESGSTSGKHK